MVYAIRPSGSSSGPAAIASAGLTGTPFQLRSGSSVGPCVPNGAIVHHGSPSASAAARTSVIGRNAAAPRSIGTSPPAAAVHPGRLQELLAGLHQVGGAGPDPLRVAGQHAAARGHVVEQQFHPVGQHRGERLHALDA